MTNTLFNNLISDPADYPTLNKNITVSVLEQNRLLQITSSDNLKLLQGQFTCDVREVNNQQWRYGALCTPKGRMRGNFLLSQEESNNHLLRLPESIVEPIQTTLNKIMPFYKGVAKDVSADYIILGFSANQVAPDIFQNTLTTLFIKEALSDTSDFWQKTESCFLHDDFSLFKLDEHRVECWLKTDKLPQYWPQITEQAKATDMGFWNLLNIQAGLGQVEATTVENWTPHMLNLHAINAVSFTKGCYTGQEIVARTQYKGIQKRKLYRIQGYIQEQKTEGENKLPSAGETLFCTASEHKAGEIVCAAYVDKKHWQALAVISQQQAELGLYYRHPHNDSKAGITILTLPYTVEEP